VKCCALAVASSVLGCGAGSGDEAANPSGAAERRGTVVVTVKDVLGAPVKGALVTLYSVPGSSQAIADASGNATFADIAPGFISLSAYDESVGAAGASSSVRLQNNGHVEVAITVQASANPAIRVGAPPTKANAKSANVNGRF
jgi:hypothetical protein